MTVEEMKMLLDKVPSNFIFKIEDVYLQQTLDIDKSDVNIDFKNKTVSF